MYTITVYTDSTLKIERTESATAEAKHDQYEQWYARVNSECDCDKTEKCGDRYRSIVQKIAAEGALSSSQQRLRLIKAVHNVQRHWFADSKHYSKLSATCDHAHMPRELLPRLGRGNSLSPDKWPYLSQSTTNDVKAIRYIRSAQSSTPYSTMWRTLQPRLQQYATTGGGTVAEAFVTNDYWWLGQVAHEKPSGAVSKAMKRRYKKAC